MIYMFSLNTKYDIQNNYHIYEYFGKVLVVDSFHFLWCQNAVQISCHGEADQAIKMCFSFTSKV
jgi:hypothetical protein